MDPSEISYDDRGLVACVVQDEGSGEVLTLAWMNAEAVRRTLGSGELHLFSRSRGTQWHKGETSGNTLAVRGLRLDCDGDAVLALVAPRRGADGLPQPACHTGARSCFHRGDFDVLAPHEALPTLERTIALRAAEQPTGSYTTTLLADPPRVGDKVMEEAEEVARAALRESDERVAEETADLLYHLVVLLRSRDLALAESERVLNGRRR
jgi:phosphoribosyl-ATP pyrophosphohydrolase/phosphoribosyl-AMP cyclohydrolase